MSLLTTLRYLAGILLVAATGILTWIAVPSSTPGVARGDVLDEETSVPGSAIALDDSWVRGQQPSRVVVVEFSDFQCRFCAQFATGSKPLIMQNYVDAGLVTWVFKPLAFSAVSRTALKAAECAGRQGRFWEATDGIFRLSAELTERGLGDVATGIGIDLSEFAACMREDGVSVRLDAALREADAIGVTGTPTFLIGVSNASGQVERWAKIRGAIDYEEFSTLIAALPALH